MTKKSKALLAAAMAGVMSAGGSVAMAGDMPKDKKASDGAHKCGGKDKAAGQAKCGGAKASDNVSCYGVNKCKGTGKCGGAGGASCAGTNSCKGQGWIPMPKDSCLAIEGGSLEAKKG